jgi:hypothetical protein
MGDYFCKIQDARQTYPRAYLHWTKQEDLELVGAFKKGAKVQKLIENHQRQPAAIISRLKSLGIEVMEEWSSKPIYPGGDMPVDLTVDELEVILDSLRYSKSYASGVSMNPGGSVAPYDLRQKKLAQIESVESKLRAAKAAAKE